MGEVFYDDDGSGSYRATPFTRGPWSPDHQHAGPPSALLARAIERLPGIEPAMVSRFTVELLRPVPVATIEVEASVARPGRSVELCTAVLRHERQEIARASAWRIRLAEIGIESLPGTTQRIPGPEEGTDAPFFLADDIVGYHQAMQWRFVRGAFTEPGPATVWMRMRAGLVAGETPSPLQRVLAAADSGNGVSVVIPYDRYLFINTDLSVHLHRLPVGEWVCLDAQTTVQSHGVGLTETVLADEQGPIGRAAQSLFVAER